MSQRTYLISGIALIVVLGIVWWWFVQAPVLQAPTGPKAQEDIAPTRVESFDSTSIIGTELDAVIVEDLETDFRELDRDFDALSSPL